MKRFLQIFITVLIVATLLNMVVYATENEAEGTNIEGATNVYDEDEYNDDVENGLRTVPEDELDGFDEYEIQQSELKELYEEKMRPYIKEAYEAYERTELVRAKVLEASDVLIEYQEDQVYGLIYKYSYQMLTLEIQEGEYKGETYEDVIYSLTEDGYENIVVTPMHKGSTVYVSMEYGEATIGSSDTAVDRKGPIILLILVTLVLIAIVAGKAGIKALIPAVLVIDLVLAFTLPELLVGTSPLIMGIVSSLLIIFVNTIVKNDFRFNKKVVSSIVVSIIVVALATLFTYGFDFLAKMNGNTIETETLSSVLLLGNVDLHGLYVLTIMVITSIIATETSCKVMNKLSSAEDNSFKGLLSSVQKVSADNLNLIIAMIIALILPKFLIYTGDKYKLAEMMNSERLILEISRMLILIIAMMITVPLTIAAWKLVSPTDNSLIKQDDESNEGIQK